MERSRARLYGLLAVIGLSTPLTLVVETVIRRLVMPPDFEEIRAWLRPQVTPWVWGAVLPATVLMTAFGIWLQRWLFRRELHRLCARLPADQAHAKAQFEALMLSTSAPQLPAVAGTVCFMLGADLLPVLATIGAATAGVLTLGFVLPERA